MKRLLLFLISVLLCCISNALNPKLFIAKFRHDKKCAISYTFDDGLIEHYTMVAPALEKRGFRGTFAICGKIINDNSSYPLDTTRMSWNQLKDLVERGHELSNHGWNHKNFARFPIEEIKEDIFKNDSVIKARTGVLPRTFVYPNNNMKEEGKAIALQNRVGTRTYQLAIGSKSTLDSLDKWIEDLITKGEWGVGMTHGITYGYDAFGDPQLFWNHLDKVKALNKQIWVGTFEEVAAYIRERQEIQLDIKRKKNKWIITPKINLDKSLYTQPLTLVLEHDNIERIIAKQGDNKLPIIMEKGKALIDFNPHDGKIIIYVKNIL